MFGNFFKSQWRVFSIKLSYVSDQQCKNCEGHLPWQHKTVQWRNGTSHPALYALYRNAWTPRGIPKIFADYCKGGGLLHPKVSGHGHAGGTCIIRSIKVATKWYQCNTGIGITLYRSKLYYICIMMNPYCLFMC